MTSVWSHRPHFMHLGLFFAAYVLGCGFAQMLAIVPGTGISIWPPSGLFMATLILTAENDPFVPPGPFTERIVRDNPHITAIVTPEGGHCAFLERAAESGPEEYDGYWAEREVLRFASSHLGTALVE